MKVIIEIGHPAHVHFFRRVREILLEKGHRVYVFTRKKSINHELLDQYNIPYLCLSVAQTNIFKMGVELFLRWIKMIYHTVKINPDVLVSISGITTSLPGRLCGKRTITFTDTEDAYLSNRLAFPFSTVVVTPTFYLQKSLPNLVKYKGLHELAYLQNYQPQTQTSNPHSVLRLINPVALHDRDINSLSTESISHLVAYLEQFGSVTISSEKPLPDEFRSLRFQGTTDQMLNHLATCSLFIGESPTMAVESALLGVPSFLISKRVSRLGNMIELQKMEILHCFQNWEEAKNALPKNKNELIGLQVKQKKLATEFIKNCTDVTDFAVKTILENKSCAD